MLTGPIVWVVPPSSRRSRPIRGREPTCPPPSPIAAAIVPISGTPRCARERRMCLCPWSRRSYRQRRVHRRPFLPPAFVSLTSGTRSSAARAGGRPSAGRTREWAALLGFGPCCRASRRASARPRWRVGRPSAPFLFWKNSVSLLFHRFE
jgi:hypothetical protein